MDSKSFTLIELVLVIGILLVLLTITIIAINPAQQFSQSNNAKRQSDVNAILNAIGQYTVDNKGVLPAGINSTAQNISKTTLDLCDILVPDYIAALPVDPLINRGSPISDCSSTYDTNYQVASDANFRVTVSAPGTELNLSSISVTR